MIDWCFTVTDTRSMMRIANFCSELLKKNGAEEKLKEKGEITFYGERGWIEGFRVYHSNYHQY